MRTPFIRSEFIHRGHIFCWFRWKFNIQHVWNGSKSLFQSIQSFKSEHDLNHTLWIDKNVVQGILCNHVNILLPNSFYTVLWTSKTDIGHFWNLNDHFWNDFCNFWSFEEILLNFLALNRLFHIKHLLWILLVKRQNWIKMTEIDDAYPMILFI